MTAPPAPVPLNQATLECPEFQKLNNSILSVQQFVTEQNAYALQYAKDGTRILEQWKVNNGGRSSLTGGSAASKARVPGPGGTIAPSEQVFTLSSPLLKPRVPHHPQLNIAEAEKRLSTSKVNESHSPATNFVTAHRTHEKRVQNKHKSKPSDTLYYLDEYQARLMERRERRRAKRAILSPPRVVPSQIGPNVSNSHSSIASSESAVPQLSPRPKKLRKRHRSPAKKNKQREKATPFKENTPSEQCPPKQKKKRAKLAPGLALMQNFQANNIARERITLKATSKVGVFNKGVVSARTNISRKKNEGSQARTKSSKCHAIFNEEAFLNRTQQPKTPLSHSSSSSTSGSDSSRHSVCSSKHHETKYGRCSQSSTQSNTRPSSRNSRKSASSAVPLQTSNIPNTDRVSRFFRKTTTVNNPAASPAATEPTRCGPQKDRERYSSPPWEIDWAAEGLPPSPCRPGHPNNLQSSVDPCGDTADGANLPGQEQREDSASVTRPTALHDLIEAEAHLSDIASASPSGDRRGFTEPFHHIANRELYGTNGIETSQSNTRRIRNQRPLAASSRHEQYPTRPDACLASPAMWADQDLESTKAENLAHRQLFNDRFQIVHDGGQHLQELYHHHILSSDRIHIEPPSAVSGKCRSSITPREGSNINTYGPIYPLYHAHPFSLSSHPHAVRDNAPPSIASHSDSEAYRVPGERAFAYEVRIGNRFGEHVYGQENTDYHTSHHCSPSYYNTERYQLWEDRPTAEWAGPLQDVDEPNIQEMIALPPNEPVQNAIDKTHIDALCPSIFTKQSRQPIHHQANEEIQEFSTSDAFNRDFHTIESTYFHPAASDYGGECHNVHHESPEPCSVPHVSYSYEATLDEHFNSPSSADNSAVSDQYYNTEVHDKSGDCCLPDTNTFCVASTHFHEGQPQSPSLLSRSSSPPLLRNTTHKPFQQGRALLLGIETMSSASDTHLGQDNYTGHQTRYLEHAGQDESVLLSVVQELERSRYWTNGDARRCR